MSTFVVLADNDPGFDLRQWLRSFTKEGKRIAAAKVDVVEEVVEAVEEVEEVATKDSKKKGKKGDKKAVVEVKEEKKKEKKKEEKEGEVGGVMSMDQKVDLVDKQFLTLLPSLFAASADSDDVEIGFSLVQHVIGELDQKVQASVIAKLVTVLTANPTVATSLKLALLTSLFNSSYLESAAASGQRAAIYTSLVQLALATSNASLLVGSYSEIEQWIAEWKLSKAKQAELYLLLSQLTKAAGELADSTTFTLKYLKTVEAAGLPLGAAKDVALSAVLSILSSPSIAQYDEYLNLAAVQQLSADKKTAHIYQLLKIFAVENVDSYTKLAAEKKDLLAGTGLVHDEVVTKLRTLTISSLGLASERISYADLAKKLSLVDVNEVEAVVIDAVLSGRVDAKLDQDSQTVIIQRTSPRAFSVSSWADLGNKLRAWRDNVGAVLESLEAVQSPVTESSSH